MKAVFLDRDGVLSRVIMRDGKPFPPATLDEFDIDPEAQEAVARLKALGFVVIVVTNQPDVRRGTQTRQRVDQMHGLLRTRLPVDDILACFHDDSDGCACRKPKPGMLVEAARTHSLELEGSYLIGDRWRDVDAGKAAGCKVVQIDRGYRERRPSAEPDARVSSLREAVEWIVNHRSTVQTLSELKVKLFADGADKAGMLALAANPHIRGFTTNPTLMRKAGVTDYEAFARGVLDAIRHVPVSFEVLADEFEVMERQARKIAAWGSNVYVKIPVTNTVGESAAALIRRLSEDGLKLNVTAVLALDQVCTVVAALAAGAASILSIFAGRIADTGRDPVPVMAEAVKVAAPYAQIEVLWASPRELLNVFQADAVGCHIITATEDLLGKLHLIGKDLHAFSRETVDMFYRDGRSSGLQL